MKDASIVLFSTHGVAALRSALYSIWETVAEPSELIVLATHPEEAVATYLTRQYLRGRIAGYELDDSGPLDGHCGLDRAFHVTSGKYLVRVGDDVRFAPQWLEKTVSILDDNPDIGCLSLVQAPEQRKRGRPRKVREEPEEHDHIDTHCFVTRHRLFERHECELMGERLSGGCLFQTHLRSLGYKLAYLPGQVRRATAADLVSAAAGGEMEADLPRHEGATGGMQKLRQTYQLCDEILATCMACGGSELEVLSARIDFCQRHNVAVGFTYELRCQDCHEVHHEADTQFRCPT